MESIRVLITDDHALLRAGIRSLLHGIEGIEVVGEACDGREAMKMVDILRPHVLLIDISMPNMNGLVAARQINEAHPEVRIAILSMHSTEDFVDQAVQAGAVGYLLKNTDAAELEFAIRAVARGETYLTPAVSKQMLASYRQAMNGNKPLAANPLTRRQTEILQLIAEGNSTKEMSLALGISVKTVETHRLQLMERLNIHDIPGLVRYAMRIGLVSAEN